MQINFSYCLNNKKRQIIILIQKVNKLTISIDFIINLLSSDRKEAETELIMRISFS